MTRIRRTALVPYSAEAMYALVNDVEAYPQFLPWCTGVTVHERGEESLRATLEIAKGAVRQRFTTHNRMLAGRRIEMRLAEGPFKSLYGTWLFQPLGERGCEVSLDMCFELAGGLLGLTLGQVFNPIASSLVDAFCTRAAQCYGPG
ncbi:MAG: type II toxin-antitoxin system RatA family toxin [Gammaproteobacteria bacterium]